MNDNKKYDILIDNIDKIADSFELNETFWEKLRESGIFPDDYINYMKEQDIEYPKKKKCIISDIKRRHLSISGLYAKFATILRLHFNSNILDVYEKCLADDGYPIVSRIPGYCLIINNKDFSEDHYQTRSGSEHDVTKFENMFKSMDYELITKKNLEKEKMQNLLDDISKREKLKNHDIFVAVIMSHGISENVVTSDSNLISYQDIYSYFSDERCKHLVGKPKVFIFNCCRSPKSSYNKIVSNKKPSKLTFGDILIIFSTLDTYQSVRDINLGTWFADAFIKAMEENGIKRDDIHNIGLKANRILQDKVKNSESNTVETRQTIEQRLLGIKQKVYFK